MLQEIVVKNLTFTRLFKTILTAGKDQSRKAAREMRKFLYSSRSGGKNESKEIQKIIETAPVEYVKISEDWRRENFVMAISVMYFLHDREGQPDFLFPWLFQLLQHKNGNIRHAAVRMIEHELGPLTYHIRFPNEEINHRELSPEQADGILLGLRTNLNNLATNSYVDQLPNGTYKSIQLILGALNDYCDYAPNQTQIERIETKEQIIERRKEIEQELAELLKETESGFTLDHIRDAIYNEEDNDDMMKVVAMFDRGGDATELENVLDLVTDAWNYFPHKVLGGISPAEKLLEYNQRQSS